MIKLPKYAKYKRDPRKHPKWELITNIEYGLYGNMKNILKTDYTGWVLVENCSLKY